MGFLIDTCIWIDLERGVISPADIAGYTGEEAVHISPVVIAELTFGAEMAAKEEIRIRRLAATERLKEKPFVLICGKKEKSITIGFRIYGWQVRLYDIISGCSRRIPKILRIFQVLMS